MKKVSVFALSMGSGGAERVISLLLPKLEKDYEVTLFLMFNVFHYTIPENIRIVVVSTKPILSNVEKVLLIPKTLYRYLHFIKYEKIDISISFLTLPNLINSLLKIFYKRVKVVISERNYPSIEYRSSYFRYYLYKILIPILYPKADILFSNSEWINKDLSDNFRVRMRMKVIYNPINLPKSTKEFLNIENDKRLRFINVGRFIATKNQTMVIDAFSEINPSNYILTFLGDGIMKNQLMKLVEFKDLASNIKFEGNVQDVNKHLLHHECFILSSNSEGFPNALLEAMAIGLPVISTNCKSGPLELLNDNEVVDIEEGDFYLAKYGILINVNDPKGLIKAVEYLIKNKDAIIMLSNSSLLRAQDFELSKIYEEFKEKLISSVN